MAATAVGNLIGKLMPLLNDEVTILKGVHGKVNEVKNELLRIQAYLKDADGKAEMADSSSSHAVKEWVKQLREAAFCIEDAVDMYMFRVAELRPSPRERHGLREAVAGALCHIGFVIGSFILRHEVTSDIVSITASIQRLYEEKQCLRLNPSAPESGVANRLPAPTRHDLRMGAHYIKDDELVGVDDTKNLLTHWLLHGETTRTVISVVGEGGLGKTTIVRNVYNKYKENRSFDCYAWITVSHSFLVEHLLKTILQNLYENDGNKYAAKEISEKVMDKDTLTRELREYLQRRSYMIVVDDVWEIDFWGGVEFALPVDSNKRSRIIITTRDKGVAEFCQRSALVHIHELKPMHSNDALELFNRKTFQFDPKGCPEELKALSKSFVKKCEGVPLAIVAISGLLSTKQKNASEWQKVYDSLRSKFSSDLHLRSFHQVLSESYNDLPYHLKLCLLFFGLFPEDYTIMRTRLIRLWVAEGFVNENDLYGDQTLEEAAEDYLAELIRRSLVKVSNVYAHGGVRSCRVHDLMHNFIVRKCEELNFCQVVKNQEFIFHKWTRRLSIHKISEGAVIEKDQSYGRVRSCISCDIKQLPASTLKFLLSCFKLLVTLDFEDSPLDQLPEAIGNLPNLKYLSVRKTKINTIPKFIGKLQNLETLNLKDTQVQELPIEINRLVKLRHLLSYSTSFYVQSRDWRGVRLNEGIGGLLALQNLVMVDTTNGDRVIKEMENLKNMRRLGIIKLSKENGNHICNAIKNMPRLRALLIKAVEEHEFLELQSLVDPPLHLQRLYLDGRLERLPEWIPKLKHLVRLRLNWSGLSKDPLPVLKDLPELLELYLYSSYDGDELHFKYGWFGKLKELRLQWITGLRTLKIDEWALPNLEDLRLGPSPQMVQAPDDIQNLEALKHLYLYKMPSQFVDDISTKLKEDINLYIFTNSPTMTQGDKKWDFGELMVPAPRVPKRGKLRESSTTLTKRLRAD